MVTEPGTKVLITQDCRTGGVATGQIGTWREASHDEMGQPLWFPPEKKD